MGRSSPHDGHERPADPDVPGLESILEEIDAVVEPVTEAVSMAPAVGIAVAGGPIVTLPEQPDEEIGGASTGAAGAAADVGVSHDSRRYDSIAGGLTQAGPVAVAGLIVNGAAVIVVVAVARLVTPRAYGTIAQLLGLFFILSMPGSAVLVGVVRRVAALQRTGRGGTVRGWVGGIRRFVLTAIAVEAVVVVALQGWIARQLSLPDSGGVAVILVSGGIWILLSVDRGLLQAHRSYRALAGNLLVEGGFRTVCVVALVAAGLGVAGYALGVFVSEVVATLHARWLSNRAWPPGRVPGAAVVDPAVVDPAVVDPAVVDPAVVDPAVVDPAVVDPAAVDPAAVDPAVVDPVAEGSIGADPVDVSVGADPDPAGRRLLADVSAAFVGLAFLGLLQNVDVILLGRLDHANVGPYAAISVASKALVFGAIALGAYLLPEATIRWNEGGHAVRQLGVTLIFLAVPAAILLGISVVAPRRFLTLVFGAKLSSAAPAFSTLVLAMMCLAFTVLVTNYLFGTGSRWIVFLLAAGSVLAVVLVAAAGGRTVATARADLVAQAVLAAGMGAAFVAVHRRHRPGRWIVPQRGRRSITPSPRPSG